MSSYKMARYPRDKYRFRLFDNIFQYKTAAEVLAAHPGAVGCINLGYFALTDIPSAGVKAFDHQCAVMISGGWVRSPEWPWPGLCIDAEGYATVGYDSDAKFDYIASVQADYIEGKQTSTKAWGSNGVTYTGWLADGTMVALLASADDGLTSAEAVQILLSEGCISILRWDGSWSSQGQLLPGVVVKPSTRRTVRSWLIIYPRDNDKEEDEPVSKTVCLDPGHGPGCVNGSPDGTYKEYEFAWDMSQRVKAHLERCGIQVVMTKEENGYPTLTERADVSNKAKADLFVSFHSNAEGITGWGTARGFLIYTSSGPETAARNVAAKKIIDRAQAAGVSVKGTGLLHELYTVLTKTTAPAVLIEYGFHTNKEDVALLKSDAHRATLAEATAKGVCDFLGIAWVDKPADGGDTSGAADWAAEAWAKAKDKGIMDGTRPTEPVTRQELAVVLDRLGQLDGLLKGAV